MSAHQKSQNKQLDAMLIGIAELEEMLERRDLLMHRLSLISNRTEALMTAFAEVNDDDIEYEKKEIEYVIDETGIIYNDIAMKQQEAIGDVQNGELQSRIDHLAQLKTELSNLEIDLERKEKEVIDLQTEIDAECVLLEEKRAIFDELSLERESKSKEAELENLQEYQRLKADSARLDQEIILINLELKSNGEKCHEMSEHIDLKEAEYQQSLAKLEKLQHKISEKEKVLAREERKNKNDILKLEATESELLQLAQRREDYDNLKKSVDELTDQIKSKFGDSSSIEDLILQHKADLTKLNSECVVLNSAIDEEKRNSIQSKITLKKLLHKRKKVLKAKHKETALLSPQSSKNANEPAQQLCDIEQAGTSDEHAGIVLEGGGVAVQDGEVAVQHHEAVAENAADAVAAAFFVEPSMPAPTSARRSMRKRRNLNEVNASGRVHIQTADSSQEVREICNDSAEMSHDGGSSEVDPDIMERNMRSMNLFYNFMK